MTCCNSRRKPEWLKIKLPKGQSSTEVLNIVRKHNLHTICTSGMCPNQGECWGNRTATFMIGGDVCTRSCKFCNVKTGRPAPLDPAEPENIANSVKLLGLKHAVITSVDRDDLADLGAAHWVKVIEARPEVISHNLETVRELSDGVRSRAKYDTSLQVIRQVSESGIVSKSGIMLGLGETREQILRTMDDLLAVGCKVMTIGQYLQPSEANLEVKEYVTPETFQEYERIGLEKGFRYVESGPLVRSSYHAEKHVR